ncbi:MAG: biotin/lipoyl-binding protein [Deltaproteobacteria bacterium]|nr:biotin/lipoyl-binding protein [Kofleriaceae bacterium]
MSAYQRIFASLVLGLLAAVGACTESAPPAPPPRAVRTAAVTSTSLDQPRRYSGSLLPRAQVDLSFRIAGRVDSVAQVVVDGRGRPLQEGDPVKQGDVLATLDPRHLRHESAAAAAALATARTELAVALLHRVALLQRSASPVHDDLRDAVDPTGDAKRQVHLGAWQQ